MTASEFAFLALGLVLGLASGAALIEVLRARPPSAREVRVTVAPNAIHARFPSTLSDPTTAEAPAGPAATGPGDRRWREQTPVAAGAPQARRADDRTNLATTAAAAMGIGDAETSPDAGTPVRSVPEPLWLSPTMPDSRTLVPVPMSLEPDPLTDALRTTAAAMAMAAMSDRPSASARAGGSAGAATVGAATGAARTANGENGSEPAPAGVSAAPGAAGVAAATARDSGPCADERRVADERCAVAVRAREGAGTAADALRAAQRRHDDLISATEADAAASDARAVRAAKEEAQARFREARSRAGSHDDVETAARAWLAEINQINRETRDAAARVEKNRAAATSISVSLERLAVEADAARISAEQAEEACIAAREAVARCDEQQALLAAAARADAPPRPAEPVPAASVLVDDDDIGPGESMGSRAGHDALILRILRGDHAAMQLAVAKLAGAEADEGRRWQARLGALADALIARSIEAAALDFPSDHFFWSLASQAENRDIASALSSLGFRFDGFGGWADERVPAQRDLSLAVGYAGLDPMRVRHWPNEEEMRDLLRDVRVAADEYVASTAGGMTLGELITLLGRRADALTDLWNDWGTVRPVLLEAA